MFEADGEAHVAGRDAGRELLLGRQLLMRGRGRMNGERARVADVGDMIEKLERVDELAPRLDAALELEADQAAVAAFEIGVGAAAGLARLQAGEDDVGDVAAPLRKFATSIAFSLCWRSRSGSVSSPCRSWKALNGEIAAPMSRNSLTRARNA